jgi:hypothetical protein
MAILNVDLVCCFTVSMVVVAYILAILYGEVFCWH